MLYIDREKIKAILAENRARKRPAVAYSMEELARMMNSTAAYLYRATSSPERAQQVRLAYVERISRNIGRPFTDILTRTKD